LLASNGKGNLKERRKKGRGIPKEAVKMANYER
jgi:hypothetical protein